MDFIRPNDQNPKNDRLAGFEERLVGVETLLSKIHDLLVDQESTKEWYTVQEIAEKLGRSEFTVREWCRLNRVLASKRACGRGNSKEWIIAADELERIRNEGLLPLRG